jgi:hypothetical protein
MRFGAICRKEQPQVLRLATLAQDDIDFNLELLAKFPGPGERVGIRGILML